MLKVLEAVPNFSEGRDLDKVEELVAVIAARDVDVLDWSADPDHHRSVVTFVGEPDSVVDAAIAAAAFSTEHFDLRGHEGVHPRVGALDVLPFVPLEAATMDDAVAAAHEAADAVAALGVPVYLYGRASATGSRSLAELRRGGVEALWGGFPRGREPDRPGNGATAHPTAGVTCVGARPILLAWNVFVEGVSVEDARAIASLIRERDGGFPGLRALGLSLPRQNRIQISMNLEDVDRTAPLEVFRRIELEIGLRGGEVVETQVIGLMPDALVLPSAADRLHVPDFDPGRVLSRRIDRHLLRRAIGNTQTPDDAK